MSKKVLLLYIIAKMLSVCTCIMQMTNLWTYVVAHCSQQHWVNFLGNWLNIGVKAFVAVNTSILSKVAFSLSLANYACCCLHFTCLSEGPLERAVTILWMEYFHDFMRQTVLEISSQEVLQNRKPRNPACMQWAAAGRQQWAGHRGCQQRRRPLAKAARKHKAQKL